jgi:hypothetical protein
MDWSIRVSVWCIELDGLTVAKDEGCRKLLRANGYRLYAKAQPNEYWIQS